MSRRRTENNIKTDIGEARWGDIDWIDLAQDGEKSRVLVKAVINLRVPYDAEKFLSGRTSGRSSRRAELHSITELVVLFTSNQEVIR
jgi:hypothetical protein